MQIPIYQLNAFSKHFSGGNPACVCILSDWLADNLLLAIAKENALTTAFLVEKDQQFYLRVFTPEYELAVCGHGTLAAAAVIFNELYPTLDKIKINTQSAQIVANRYLHATKIRFPSVAMQAEAVTDSVVASLGIKPLALYSANNANRDRCVAILDNENIVKNFQPDWDKLKQLEYRGIVISAKGDKTDFVSRSFYPHKQLKEDPVTGASHLALVPYWAKQLNKNNLTAAQLSARGGSLNCEFKNDYVYLSGQTYLYLKGEIYLCVK